MASVPPPQFAAYPRQEFGTAERLRQLSEGYFGLNWVFGLNVLLNIAVSVAVGVVGTAIGYAVGLLVEFALIAWFSYGQVKKIQLARGKPEGSALTICILMGLNSALCCGIVGFIVMQQIASKDMLNYGVKGGFFGI